MSQSNRDPSTVNTENTYGLEANYSLTTATPGSHKAHASSPHGENKGWMVWAIKCGKKNNKSKTILGKNGHAANLAEWILGE